ncbi:hypothetical protein MN608_08309 [Microdochium nivale]|nr:hypothetical protein MN608_08309 [Microdochium nivale]
MASPSYTKSFTPFAADPSHSNIKALTESIEGIPRYLFRVHDPGSPGLTTISEVRSPATQHGGGQPAPADLYQLVPTDAAQLLDRHLRWRCETSHWTSSKRCNLMSWTSSLLVALQYALHRHEMQFEKPSLSDIKILMADTKQFGTRRVFARDLQAIEAYKDFLGEHCLADLHARRSSGEHYFGEYISQGNLGMEPGLCCEVTLQQLVDLGLFRVCEGLGDQARWTRWAIRVNELRAVSIAPECDIPDAVLKAVVEVARAFNEFEVPAAAMLLGLTPYEPFGPNSVKARNALAEAFTGNSVGILTGAHTLGGHLTHLPELLATKAWYEGFRNVSVYRVKRLKKPAASTHEQDKSGNHAGVQGKEGNSFGDDLLEELAHLRMP